MVKSSNEETCSETENSCYFAEVRVSRMELVRQRRLWHRSGLLEGEVMEEFQWTAVPVFHNPGSLDLSNSSIEEISYTGQ